jgi:hypothetical protein
MTRGLCKGALSQQVPAQKLATQRDAWWPQLADIAIALIKEGDTRITKGKSYGHEVVFQTWIYMEITSCRSEL